MHNNRADKMSRITRRSPIGLQCDVILTAARYPADVSITKDEYKLDQLSICSTGNNFKRFKKAFDELSTIISGQKTQPNKWRLRAMNKQDGG